MGRTEAVDAFASNPVGYLATTRPDGNPHVVPITFAVTDDTVVTMIDHKPKTTGRLQRIVNLEHRPRASVLADYYTENWSELWWVRIDGRAEIHDEGEIWDGARLALTAKYSQYRERPPTGAAIAISIEQITSWAGTP